MSKVSFVKIAVSIISSVFLFGSITAIQAQTLPPSPTSAPLAIEVTSINAEEISQDCGNPTSTLCGIVNAVSLIGNGGTITFNHNLLQVADPVSGQVGRIILNRTLQINRTMTINGIVNGGQIKLSGSGDITNSAGVTIFTVSNTGNLILQNLRIANGNPGTTHGGGIRNEGGTVSINNSIIERNKPLVGVGGGIYNTANGTIEIEESQIIQNVAQGNSNRNGDGGGIYNENGTIEINRSIISGNWSDSTIALPEVQPIGGLTIPGGGAGIFNKSFIKIENSVIADNNATVNQGQHVPDFVGGLGGGLFNAPGGIANIYFSTFTGNSANYQGGAIINRGDLVIFTSTIAGGNLAYQIDNGISNQNAMQLWNVTLADNGAPGLSSIANLGYGDNIYGNNTSFARIYNTIIANPRNSSNCSPLAPIVEAVKSLQYPDLSCQSPNQEDIRLGNPNLDVLKNNGGFTSTMQLKQGSAAINGGDQQLCLSDDQRGITRVANVYGYACDIGAYESNTSPDYLYRIVTNRDDTDDGTCDATNCTLREAVISAPSGQKIQFVSAAIGTITLSAPIEVQREVEIVNTLTQPITLSNPNQPIFRVDFDGTLTLERLNVSQSTGIENQGILNIVKSTLHGNTGSSVVSNSGTATIVNSTIANNSAMGISSAISSTTNIINSTLVDNNHPSNDGLLGENIAASNIGTMIVKNSIISNNNFERNCSGNITDGGNNLVWNGQVDGSCGFTNPVNADPKLSPLSGIPTQMMALKVGSPAIDAGNNDICAASPVNNRDQRNLMRLEDGDRNGIVACDIGAFEYYNPIPTNTPSTTRIVTRTFTPTNTATATFTASNMPTRTATNTSSVPTNTPTRTLTPSRTPTRTRVPPTQPPTACPGGSCSNPTRTSTRTPTRTRVPPTQPPTACPGGSCSNPTRTPTRTFTPTITPLPLYIWVEDALPAGGVGAGSEGWNWIGSNPLPDSGALSHQSIVAVGQHGHSFVGATNRMNINSGDVLIASVYIDPANLPAEIMLSWREYGNNSWEHRAYWGANLIDLGTNGTNSRRKMGELPPAGQWIRLQIPASQVGLEGKTVDGMGFNVYNGRATWDRAGRQTGG